MKNKQYRLVNDVELISPFDLKIADYEPYEPINYLSAFILQNVINQGHKIFSMDDLEIKLDDFKPISQFYETKLDEEQMALVRRNFPAITVMLQVIEHGKYIKQKRMKKDLFKPTINLINLLEKEGVIEEVF